MLINCAICGPRDGAEFTYLGDASIARPPVQVENPDDAASVWSNYVFARENPRGMHEGYWQHSGGCRAILRLRRDVTSHEIFAVRLVGPHGETGDKAGAK